MKVNSQSIPSWFYLMGFAVVGIVYSLGLSGTFLFDDYGTLSALDDWGQINSFQKFKQFILGGFTGPTGRPLSLVSFALQAENWPNNPYPFLVVNVLLHLLNAVLVFIFLRSLLKQLNVADNLQIWLPCLASLIWAAHPLQVSTVLYVVQRMVLLAALFNLLSLVIYLSARKQIFEGKLCKSITLFALAAICAVLAVFSKENAILIPLQLLLIESVIRWSGKKENTDKYLRLFKIFKLVGIIIPSLIVIAYLGDRLFDNAYSYFINGHELYTRRSFTMFERLMSECRILGEYLTALLIPRGQGSGLFFDDYIKSTGLLNPISTVVWLLIHTFVISIAIACRKKIPLIALAILWFYINHLIESSVIMLELKFEHRNYIPSIGIALLVAYGCLSLPVTNRIKLLASGFIVTILILLLAYRASLWGEPEKASLVWVVEAPNSVRALENAALVLSKKPENGAITQGLLKKSAELSSSDPIILLKYYSYTCNLSKEESLDIDIIAEKLKISPLNWQAGGVFDEILSKKIAGLCSTLSVDEYQKLLKSIRENQYYKRTRLNAQLQGLLARSELVFGDPVNAVKLYQKVNYQKMPLGFIMKQSLWLASYGQQNAAAKHLQQGIKYAVDADEFVVSQAKDMLSKIESDIEPEVDKNNLKRDKL